MLRNTITFIFSLQILKLYICNGEEEWKKVKEIRGDLPQELTKSLRKRVGDNWPHIIKILGDPNYNPSQGFEPYWPGGDWVIQEETVAPGQTTTPIPLVCGDICEPIYQQIKQVCAQKLDQYYPKKLYCWYCYYNEIWDFSHGTKTFDSYCSFLDAKCSVTWFGYSWVMIHEGPCIQDQQKIFKPLAYPGTPVSRMLTELTRLYSFYSEFNLKNSDNTILYPFRTVTTTPIPPPITTNATNATTKKKK